MDSKHLLIYILLILSILGISYGSGWHIADEILGGNFSYDYNYTGIVDFTEATVYGLDTDNWVDTTGDTMTGSLTMTSGDYIYLSSSSAYGLRLFSASQYHLPNPLKNVFVRHQLLLNLLCRQGLSPCLPDSREFSFWFHIF